MTTLQIITMIDEAIKKKAEIDREIRHRFPIVTKEEIRQIHPENPLIIKSESMAKQIERLRADQSQQSRRDHNTREIIRLYGKFGQDETEAILLYLNKAESVDHAKQIIAAALATGKKARIETDQDRKNARIAIDAHHDPERRTNQLM